MKSQRLLYLLLLSTLYVNAQVPPPPARGRYCNDDVLTRNYFTPVWDGGWPLNHDAVYYSPKAVVFEQGFFSSANTEDVGHYGYGRNNLHAYIATCEPEWDEDNASRKSDLKMTALEITLSPNPNNGVFELALGQLLSGNVLISDAQGRQVYAQSFFETDTVKIDMTGKANGVYFLSLAVADNRVVKRFVKL